MSGMNLRERIGGDDEWIDIVAQVLGLVLLFGSIGFVLVVGVLLTFGIVP